MSGEIHTYKRIGGKDYHYINGELAFVDGRPQPRWEGTESSYRRKNVEDGPHAEHPDRVHEGFCYECQVWL